jgi:hypothetical protein
MLCGLQLTVPKRLDLAARDSESVLAHVASYCSSLAEAWRAPKAVMLGCRRGA